MKELLDFIAEHLGLESIYAASVTLLLGVWLDLEEISEMIVLFIFALITTVIFSKTYKYFKSKWILP